MKKMDLRKIAFLLIVLIPAMLKAQEWVPVLTEKWEPVPEKVTPGKSNAPPSDAVVLFDGTGLSKWESERGGTAAQWELEDGVMTVIPRNGSIQTKESFGDIQLHVEWRAPLEPQGDGQDHGNSGIFLQGRYEIQVLDCYENTTYVNGQTARFISNTRPWSMPACQQGNGSAMILSLWHPALMRTAACLHLLR